MDNNKLSFQFIQVTFRPPYAVTKLIADMIEIAKTHTCYVAAVFNDVSILVSADSDPKTIFHRYENDCKNIHGWSNCKEKAGIDAK